jgi:wyosine [tRNA(Phe)-imidazoG37] synthetase (radical SAM superfamily)
VDLTKEVTVFLITVGASSYPRAKKALKKQNCQFTFKEIAWMAPMSAAFQEMLNQCETPYFVQCDEDMICKPFAVKALYDSIANPDMKHQFYAEFGWSPDECAMVCHPLWDVHLQRTRLGIKIYRHEAMVQAPYQDKQSCEMDQLERIKSLGFHYRTEWGSPWSSHNGKLNRTDQAILALHGTSYTPREAFTTYLDMAQKCRDVGGNDWFRDHPKQFLDQVLAKQSAKHPYENEDLWALFGCVAGFSSKKETREQRGEKNFNQYYENSEFGELRSMLVPAPSRLDVYTTNKCNLKCDFCGRQKGGVDMNVLNMNRDEDLPQNVDKMLQYYPSITSACVAGFGEPLMCDSLNDVLTILQDRFVGLITNGVALPTASVNWEKVNHLTVSLNAGTKEEHQARTGVSDGWDRVTAGLQMLNRIKVPFTLSFVIGQKEWINVEEYLEVSKQLGAKSVYLVNLLPHHNDQAGAEWFAQNVLHYQHAPFFAKKTQYERKANELGVQVEVWPQPISWSVKPRN